MTVSSMICGVAQPNVPINQASISSFAQASKELATRTNALGCSAIVAASPHPSVEVKMPALVNDFMTPIGTLKTLGEVLPSNTPTVLLEIIHEYRLQGSEDSIDYVKNLINCIEENNQGRGYALLAGLIAAQCIDLVRFGITPKVIVGLAPYMSTQTGITFDTHLEPMWKLSEWAKHIIGEPRKKRKHDILLAQILHFADAYHLNRGGADLHLVGKACDSTQGVVSHKIVQKKMHFHVDIQEVSRIRASVRKIYAEPRIFSVVDRSMKLYPASIYKPYWQPAIKAFPEKMDKHNLLDKSTENSVWDFCLSSFWDSLLSKKWIDKFQEKRNVSIRILVNTYRVFQENLSELESNREPILNSHSIASCRCAISKTLCPDVYTLFIKEYRACIKTIRNIYEAMSEKETFDELLRTTPLRSTIPIQYQREPRAPGLLAEFYNDIVKKAEKEKA